MIRHGMYVAIVVLLAAGPASCQEDLAGEWVGKSILTSGLESKVEIVLEKDGEDYVGSFSSHLAEDEEKGKSEGQIRMVTRDGEIVRMIVMVNKGPRIEYELRGELEEETPRSKRVFYGTLKSVTEGMEYSGVFIFWKGD